MGWCWWSILHGCRIPPSSWVSFLCSYSYWPTGSPTFSFSWPKGSLHKFSFSYLAFLYFLFLGEADKFCWRPKTLYTTYTPFTPTSWLSPSCPFSLHFPSVYSSIPGLVPNSTSISLFAHILPFSLHHRLVSAKYLALRNTVALLKTSSALLPLLLHSFISYLLFLTLYLPFYSFSVYACK